MRGGGMQDADCRHGIYFLHRAALVDYAALILGSREAAEDIVQDAFLKFVPEKVRAVTPEQTLGYLFRVVRNLAFDVLKHRKVERRDQLHDAPYWAFPRTEPTPEEHTLFRDELRCISRVMADLPIETRIAVEMHRFGGYTLEEVAAHLGLPLATVYRHVRMAMVKIAAALESTSA